MMALAERYGLSPTPDLLHLNPQIYTSKFAQA